MSWTEVFPVFDDEMLDDYDRLASPEEKDEIEQLYGVRQAFSVNPNATHIVSYSLFWKNIREGGVPLPVPSREAMMNAVELGLAQRFDPWSHYVKPLLEEVPRLKETYPNVAFRVYLALDLDFLIEDLVASGCEVFWMKHSSLAFAPGGLWRFLPIEEPGKLVTVVDVDRIFHLNNDIARTEAAAQAGLGMWRVPVYTDLTKNGAVSYLPIVGCHSGWQGGNLQIRKLLDAFTWRCRTGQMPTTVDYPNCGPRLLLQARWPDYGFDEWFMMAAVYPRAAQEGVLTFVPNNAKGMMLTLDVEYVTWANPNSQLIYFPLENCCAAGPDPGQDFDGPIPNDVGLDEAENQQGVSLEAEEVAEDESQVSLPYVTARRDQPKVGLLFLTRGDSYHGDLWQEYIDSEPDRFRAFCHAKRPEDIETKFLSDSLISEFHETEWGKVSLIRAMASLLRAGIEDRDLTHFMFLSESCIPIRPASEILDVLSLDGRSRFSYMTASETERTQPGKIRRIDQGRDIPRDRWRFHSQWTLLNREAAKKVVSVDLIEQFRDVFAADESWVGTSLAIGGWNLSAKVVRRNPTWARWERGSNHPELVEMADKRLLAEWRTSGCFFARKVAPEALAQIGNPVYSPCKLAV